MRRLISLATLIVGLSVSQMADAAVGYQRLSIPDPGGPPIEAGVWYPSEAAPENINLELFPVSVAQDAPVAGVGRPLVMMSHGNGGAFTSHIDTAIALAEAGMIAVAITHAGDNWRDQSRATAVWERSRQLKVATDYVLTDWAGKGAIDARRIGAFGFSAGGFTVLVSAGGRPDLNKTATHCRAHPEFYDCRLVARSGGVAAPPAGWTHDGRIRAVISAAPALGYAFDRAGLADVRQPLQLWRAEADEVLPHPFYAEAVHEALPRRPEYRVVRNAGHFDFLAPCPATLARINPMICASAAGFDRPTFHREFNAQVVRFFNAHLHGR